MNTETQSIIDTLNERIVDNASRVDLESRYCDTLDKCYNFKQVGGPFAGMCASRVLREVDLIAYSCGLADFIDSENLVKIDGDYYEETDAESAREELISELESQMSGLEEIQPCDSETLMKIARANLDLETLKAHVWDR